MVLEPVRAQRLPGLRQEPEPVRAQARFQPEQEWRA
jgi:hypothetical protein